MIIEAALPTAPVAPAGVQLEQPAPETTTDAQESKTPEAEQAEKAEKTPEQREIDRLRRGIDRKTRQVAEARAEAEQLRRTSQVRSPGAPANDTTATPDDDQPVSLSRRELDALVNERAAKLAPTIKQQADVIEQRQGVVQGLAKEWGQEKFDAYAADLDEAFSGLVDRSGNPKPATNAIFESEMPRALIEYLADPENADEAESIGRMDDRQAARAVVKLEQKLQAVQQEAKAKAKPQPSSAAPPIESVRGGGSANDMPDPSDTKAYMKWANAQERK